MRILQDDQFSYTLPRMRVLTSADYRTMPWKNGAGATTELVRCPENEEIAFDWRVSIADIVEDGPFSQFPGCDRTIIVTEGDGIALRHGTAPETTLRPLDVHRFSGDDETTVRLLHGSTRDFNLITRRGRVDSHTEVRLLRVNEEGSVTASVLHCLSGEVVVATGDERVTLRQGETAVSESATRLFIHATKQATLIVVVIENNE